MLTKIVYSFVKGLNLEWNKLINSVSFKKNFILKLNFILGQILKAVSVPKLKEPHKQFIA